MEFLYSASGANVQPIIREFRIKSDTVVKKGQIVNVDEQGRVKAGKSIILGVAAEDHSGVEDESNPRSNGEKIKVICSPNSVYKLYGTCIKFCHDDSEPGAFVTRDYAAGSGDNIFGNCILVLTKKAEDSENTDPVGTVYYVDGNSYDAMDEFMTFSVCGGTGVPDDDDEYAIIANVGNLTVGPQNDDNNVMIGNDTQFACVGCTTSLNNEKGLPYSHVVIADTLFSKQLYY